MTQPTATGVALCTTWSEGDQKLWRQLANEALAEDALAALAQVTHIAVRMAEALASLTDTTVSGVLEIYALDAERDRG